MVERLQRQEGVRVRGNQPNAQQAVRENTAARVRSVGQEFGLLTELQAAGLLARSGEHHPPVSELVRCQKLLYITVGTQLTYPGVQFDRDAGTIRPAIAPLLLLAREHGRRPENVTLWLSRATSYLNGDRPVDRLGDLETVLEAADQAWSVDW